jgi:hypothetical protein
MIQHTLCNSYKLELLKGIHQESDLYMIALYKKTANLGKKTQKYLTTDEVVGFGYKAGGLPLAGIRFELIEGIASMTWNIPVWMDATLRARAAIIYNSSKGDRAVAVLDFGEEVASTRDKFSVKIPEGLISL